MAESGILLPTAPPDRPRLDRSPPVLVRPSNRGWPGWGYPLRDLGEFGGPQPRPGTARAIGTAVTSRARGDRAHVASPTGRAGAAGGERGRQQGRGRQPDARRRAAARRPSTALVPVTAPDASRATAPRTPARETLLREIRILLQAAVVNAFDTLVDVPRERGPEPDRGRSSTASSTTHGFAVTRDERDAPRRGDDRRRHGLRPDRAAAPRRDDHRGDGQRPGPHLHRARRQDPARRHDVPQRRARPADHRPDHHADGPAHRRDEPARRRAPARRLARQRDHRAAVAHRPGHHRPQVLDPAVHRRRPRSGFGTATPEMFDFLRACIEARLNLFVSGGTGSGKTTTLNVLSSFIPERRADRHDRGRRRAPAPPGARRSRSSRARPTSRARARSRSATCCATRCTCAPTGSSSASAARGEALDMLQAMTTGHDGSLSTGHANSPRGHAPPPRDDGPDDRLPAAAARHPRADRLGRRPHRPHRPPQGRLAQDRQHHRGLRDRGRRDPDPGHLRVRADRRRATGRSRASCVPTGIRPTFMPQFARNGVELPPGEFGIPQREGRRSRPRRRRSSRAGAASATTEGAATPRR